jgi:hypothetical protein
MTPAVNTVTGNLAVSLAVPEQPRYRLLHGQYEKVLSKSAAQSAGRRQRADLAEASHCAPQHSHPRPKELALAVA